MKDSILLLDASVYYSTQSSEIQLLNVIFPLFIDHDGLEEDFLEVFETDHFVVLMIGFLEIQISLFQLILLLSRLHQLSIVDSLYPSALILFEDLTIPDDLGLSLQ